MLSARRRKSWSAKMWYVQPRWGVLLMIFASRTYGSTSVNFRPKPYGTKTAYNLSLTTSERDIIDNPGYLLAPSFCRPVHVNGVFRHGTREPSRSDVVDFYALRDKIQGNITNPAFSTLNSWSPIFDLTDEDNKNLAPVGEQELFLFGQRFAQTYPSLLTTATETEVNFYSSHKDRSLDSCLYFQKGYETIFEDSNVLNRTEIRDDLMRFFDHCSNYIENVDDNPDASSEAKKFLKGPEMQQVADNLTETLQLAGDMRLSPGEAKAAYLALAYEEAFTGESLWSDAFTWDQLETVEYATDLKQYWKKGYGYSINYEQSCPLLSDAMKHMDATVRARSDNSSYVKGLFQFGHAETIMPYLALLGLYKDPAPPTAATFQDNINRLFKTSLISPFAANVAMVLYECDTMQSTTPEDQARAPPGVTWPPNFQRYMVQLLVKEFPVQFPFTQYHLAPLEEVRQHYTQYLDCQFEELCRVNKGNPAVSSLAVVALAVALVRITF